MSENKKKAPQTFSGQQGKYQTSGASNNTLSKSDMVLKWVYERTTEGLRATAFDSFNHNSDTSFRTHISELCRKYGLVIKREYVRNPKTGSKYKEYWLSASDIKKVKKILNK